jgi:hypothetical protein
MVMRKSLPMISPRPIAHSQIPSSGTLTLADNRPKLSRPIVRAARSWAGLRPGSSLSAPNHGNTMPRPRRNRVSAPSSA